ncbi:ABC transporter permease [Brevibacillus sp. B_LB10_24]|uniref:ABC transporter permease n=1 Tax=Brevibacillus sp. B_LB10_24 TaxID=3380645 RepID=UPI0038B72D32
MKFHQLALKNIRGNWHQYSAFFLSSVFSVTLFFIYAAFIFHPDVINGHIRGGDKVRIGMTACEYIILIFSFFFVLYSISAFLKSRKKEFGLLALFGLTNGQIKRMVYYENLLISLLSIATGIVFGILFSKLFFMALAVLMNVDSPIRFFIPPKALLWTAGGFFLLFQAITLMTLFQVGRTEIVDLLKESKKPKSLPLASKWLVLLSAVCIGGGYYLAVRMDGNNAILVMLPILFLVIAGTYFLFTQSSVVILRALGRNKPLYYRGTNLLTISQLVFKIKDNARILFMVSILCAVVLTASATLYVFNQSQRDQIMAHVPQTIGFVEKGLHQHQVIDPQKLNEILQQDGVEIEYEAKLAGVPVSMMLKTDWQQDVLVVSATDYNQLAGRVKGTTQVQVDRGHAVFVYPYHEMSGGFFQKNQPVSTTAANVELNLVVDKEVSGAVVIPLEATSFLLVLSDEQYREIMARVPDSEKVVAYGYELKHWESTGETVKKIEQAVPRDQSMNFRSRVEDYLEMNQFNSLTLFIGVFVSFLFFIASGSIIFFKLFTELQDDQAQFRALVRIGMSLPEIRRIVSTQIAAIFFIPCVVGIVHTLFAMKSLSNLLGGNIWPYALLVVAIYIVMQSAYFFVTRRSYMKKITSEALMS